MDSLLAKNKIEKHILKMILSRENLNVLSASNLTLPDAQIFEFPEKVLQFGTGVLLRGLPDYFIDKANRQGIFKGRIAVVKSTAGATAEFDQQDSLYTLCVRGLENGKPVTENIVSSAISRVISATEDWQSVLAIAQSPELKLIVSNTTEVGIQLVNESIAQEPPRPAACHRGRMRPARCPCARRAAHRGARRPSARRG